MKKVVVLALALLVLTPVLAFSTPALALNVWNQNDASDNGNQFAADAGGFGTTDLRTTIANVIRLVISFLGIIAVVIILIGGFKWMTAGGNEDKVGEAKKLLIAGLIGLVIIILAYAIATFVLTQIAATTGPTI